MNREQERQVKEFDKRLRRAMPGGDNYSQAKDRIQIDRVLNSLAENVQSYNLWWTRGGRADLQIERMER